MSTAPSPNPRLNPVAGFPTRSPAPQIARVPRREQVTKRDRHRQTTLREISFQPSQASQQSTTTEPLFPNQSDIPARTQSPPPPKSAGKGRPPKTPTTTGRPVKKASAAVTPKTPATAPKSVPVTPRSAVSSKSAAPTSKKVTGGKRTVSETDFEDDTVVRAPASVEKRARTAADRKAEKQQTGKQAKTKASEMGKRKRTVIEEDDETEQRVEDQEGQVEEEQQQQQPRTRKPRAPRIPKETDENYKLLDTEKAKKRTVTEFHVAYTMAHTIATDILQETSNELEQRGRRAKKEGEKDASAREIETLTKSANKFVSELHETLLNQAESTADLSLLQNALKRAATEKKNLRQELLHLRTELELVERETTGVVEEFKSKEDERKKREEAHKFVLDLESIQQEAATNSSQSGDRFTSGANARAVLVHLSSFGKHIDTVRAHTDFMTATTNLLSTVPAASGKTPSKTPKKR